MERIISSDFRGRNKNGGLLEDVLGRGGCGY